MSQCALHTCRALPHGIAPDFVRASRLPVIIIIREGYGIRQSEGCRAIIILSIRLTQSIYCARNGGVTDVPGMSGQLLKLRGGIRGGGRKYPRDDGIRKRGNKGIVVRTGGILISGTTTPNIAGVESGWTFCISFPPVLGGI